MLKYMYNIIVTSIKFTLYSLGMEDPAGVSLKDG